MKKLVLILLMLFSAISRADVTVSGDGEKLVFENNGFILTIAASGSQTESVAYIWMIEDGEPGQTIITDGLGVLSFADVNAVAGTHKLLSITHTDASGDDVTRGSIIYGNSTPAWDELDIGAANTFLSSDGTDVAWGAIDISDSTNLAVTAPVTLADDTIGWDPTLIDNTTWDAGTLASIAWTWNLTAGDPTITFGDNLVTFDTVVTVEGLGTGGQTDYDLKVGDVDGSPTYGMMQIGHACIGRTSFKAAKMDLDGSMIYRNISGPVTSEIEHVFVESTGSTTRFALATAKVGNATYNSRSMLIAGPAPADTNYVKVTYWQTNNNIFDNLACDTSGVGADLGVQNDLEVEGDIFVDIIKESTSGAGITFNNSVIVTTGKNITLGTTQWNSSDEIDGTKIKDADYGDVDVSAGGAWTVSSVQNDSVALGTDTTGNYVASITDGLAIDGGDGGSEGATLTIAFDPTELLGNRIWGDASTDTIVWTWDRATGTDPTMTFGNDLVTFNGNLTAASTITGGTLTDSTASITSGDGTGFTSFVVDNLTFDGSTITSAAPLQVDTSGSAFIVTNNIDVQLTYGATGNLFLQNATGLTYTPNTNEAISFTSGTGGAGLSGGDIDLITGNRGAGGAFGGTFTVTVADSGDFIVDVEEVGMIDLNGPVDIDETLDVDEDLTVGVGSETAGVNYGLILLGMEPGAPGTRRGGNIEYRGEGGAAVAGYVYANINSQHVWDTAKASSSTDTGNAWVEFDTGNASFDQGNFTFIDAVASVTGSARSVIDSSSTATLLNINATGLAENAVALTINSNERAIQATTTDERCIFGTSTSGVGVQGSSSSNVGIDGTSVTGLAGRFTIDSASTNTTLDVIEVRRRTTDGGFGQDNIGGRICYRLENDAGSTQIAAGLDAVMTDVTDGAEITEVRISVRDGLNGLEQLYTFQHDLFTVGNANTSTGIKVGNPTVYFISEDDGDTYWAGTGTGLIYGHMFIPGVDVTVDTSATANPVEVKDDGTTSANDGWASSYQNEVTFAVSDLHYQTVTIAGTYEVIWDMSCRTAAGGGTVVHGGITIDTTTFQRNNGEGHTHIFNANDDIQIKSVGVVDCPNGNEEISLWISNNANQKTIVEHGNMRIKLIGGT